MKITIIKKLTSLFKYSICITTLASVSLTAEAQFPGCGGGWGGGCGGPKRCYKRVVTQCRTTVCRRMMRYPRAVSSIAFYYVYPVSSPCWQGQVWVPGCCGGPCNQWMTPYWEPVNYDEDYWRTPRFINDRRINYRTYDPDLATGDDAADIHPNMEIN